MKLGFTDATALAGILADAGRAAIMPRFRRLGLGDMRTKSGPLDLVTEADEAAERQITAALRARFPGALIVGEEAAAADLGLLDRLAHAEHAIVLDPLDGTFNFANGVPLFAVMTAVLDRGEVALSAIHDPMGGDTALALRGEGAWVERPDGTRIDLHVCVPQPVADMAGIASWLFLPEPQKSRVLTNLPRVAATWSYRCAGHEYRLAASGGCDFLLYRRLLPWDHAPGWLLHREAGGYSAQFDGSPYSPFRIEGGLICAPDRASWGALRETLLGVD